MRLLNSMIARASLTVPKLLKHKWLLTTSETSLNPQTLKTMLQSFMTYLPELRKEWILHWSRKSLLKKWRLLFSLLKMKVYQALMEWLVFSFNIICSNGLIRPTNWVAKLDTYSRSCWSAKRNHKSNWCIVLRLIELNWCYGFDGSDLLSHGPCGKIQSIS